MCLIKFRFRILDRLHELRNILLWIINHIILKKKEKKKKEESLTKLLSNYLCFGNERKWKAIYPMYLMSHHRLNINMYLFILNLSLQM